MRKALIMTHLLVMREDSYQAPAAYLKGWVLTYVHIYTAVLILTTLSKFVPRWKQNKRYPRCLFRS